MKQRTDSQGVPYSYLVDNIKVVLIFLVVFNHLIAFQLVKVDMVTGDASAKAWGCDLTYDYVKINGDYRT